MDEQVQPIDEQVQPIDEQVQIVATYEDATAAAEEAGELAAPSVGMMERARGAVAALQSTHVLTLTMGRRAVPNVMGKAVMVHTGGGIVYFQPDKETLYEVVEVSWDGPTYQQRLVTDTSTSSKTKGGRKGRMTGAIIGSLLLPGVGTAIGAAVGTGSKSRTKGSSRSETYQEATEVPAPCRLVLEKLSTGEEVVIATDVMSDKAPQLLELVEFGDEVLPEPVAEDVAPAPAATAPKMSIYDELRELKNLLDLGILSQEEFDAKKAELLS